MCAPMRAAGAACQSPPLSRRHGGGHAADTRPCRSGARRDARGVAREKKKSVFRRTLTSLLTPSSQKSVFPPILNRFCGRIGGPCKTLCAPPPSHTRPHAAHRPAARQRRARAAASPPPPTHPPAPPPADDGEALLLADLERYGGASGTSPSRRSPGPPGLRPPLQSPPPPPTPIKDALDRLLVADFFFVLLALAWLVTGVAVKAGGGSSAIADTWLALWMPLFQPAIGLLMAGALVSGGLGWLRDKRQED